MPDVPVLTADEAEAILQDLAEIVRAHNTFAISRFLGHSMGALMSLALVEAPDAATVQLTAAGNARALIHFARNHKTMCRGC
jgi:surfactin synthase thioesterase subunit